MDSPVWALCGRLSSGLLWDHTASVDTRQTDTTEETASRMHKGRETQVQELTREEAYRSVT